METIEGTPCEVTAEEAAQELWDEMDEDQRHGIRFGLFPAKLMLRYDGAFKGPKLSVALMDIAKNNGGMRA